MAFVMVRVEVVDATVDNLNVLVTGDTKPHEGIVQIRNLMDAILAGAQNAEVDIAIRDTSQTITAAGGGSSSSYNLK